MRQISIGSPMRVGERFGKIEYRRERVIQQWRDSSTNIRLPHLLMSFLLIFVQTKILLEGL